MNQIEAEEAELRLDELIERVARGEEFIITRTGRPVVRMIGFDAEHNQSDTVINVEELVS